jgi:hypothetical protein
LGVVAVAGPAAADPIWFTYRIDGNTTRTDAGDVSVQAVYTGPVSLDARANPSAVLATVRLGGKPTLDPGIVDGMTPDVVGQSRFALKLQITDTATREVGVVRLTGWVDARWVRTMADETLIDGTTIGFDSGLQDVTVGGRTLHVVATGAAGASDADVFGTLSVRVDSPLATPEPGTLALAGIGLAGAVGIRRRVRA